MNWAILMTSAIGISSKGWRSQALPNRFLLFVAASVDGDRVSDVTLEAEVMPAYPIVARY